MKPSETLLQRLNKIPPVLCRIVARQKNGRKPISHEELASRTGLDCSTIAKLSVRDTWGNCSIQTVSRFLEGCGIDPVRGPVVIANFLKRRKLAHLRSGNHNQVLFGRRLVALYIGTKKGHA